VFRGILAVSINDNDPIKFDSNNRRLITPHKNPAPEFLPPVGVRGCFNGAGRSNFKPLDDNSCNGTKDFNLRKAGFANKKIF